MMAIQYIWQQTVKIALAVFDWIKRPFVFLMRCVAPLISKIDFGRKNWFARLDRWGNVACDPLEAFRLLANVAVVGLCFAFLFALSLGAASPMQALAPLLISVVAIEVLHVASLLFESRKLGKALPNRASSAKSPIDADEQERFYGFAWLFSSVFVSFLYLSVVDDGQGITAALAFFVAWSVSIALLAVSSSRFPGLTLPLLFFVSPFAPILAVGTFQGSGSSPSGIEGNISNMATFLTANPETWGLFLIITAFAAVITGLFVPRYRIRGVRNALNRTSLVSNVIVVAIVFLSVHPQSFHEATLAFFESDAATYAGMVVSTLAVSSVVVGALAAIRLFDAKLNINHYLELATNPSKPLSEEDAKALKAAYLYNGGDESLWELAVR